MDPKNERFFDTSSEPIERTVATALHKLSLAIKHQGWVQAAEDGLSPTQGQILVVLLADGPLSGKEIATKLGVSLPTVSDSVRVLVEKRLARKKPDPRHPRASLVSLTPSGRARAERARSWPDYLAGAVASLSQPEQQAFLSGLLKMIRTLQEDALIPQQRMCITCMYFRPFVHQGIRPHHCGLVDAPMADQHLRVDCPEHEEAPAEEGEATWRRFVSGPKFSR